MENLTIPVKTSRLYLMAGLFTTTLALSAVIMFRLELVMMAQLRIAVMIVAFIGSTLSGYAMLYFLLRAKQKPPVLIADKDGVTWDASVFNRGMVRWASIKDYALIKHAGSTYMLVNLKDPFETIEKQQGIVKRYLSANLKRYRTPIAIPASYVEGDPAEILGQVAEFGRRFA